MKNSELRNDYGDLIAGWKLDLLLARARRLNFNKDELEDLQQELVLDILNFDYDPHNASGATEETALTRVIDNRLISILRKKLSDAVGRQDYLRRFGADGGEPVWLDVEAAEEARLDLSLDIEQILDGLPPLEREACLAFAGGKSTNAVAEALGLPWRQVAKLVGRLRKVFTDAGVAA